MTKFLISELYDSVTSPKGFQDFITSLSQLFELKAVTLLIRHVETEVIKGLWFAGITEEWIASYGQEYALEDKLALHIACSPHSHFYASNLDLPSSEHFTETRFYREWLAPQGVACAAGAVVRNDGDWLTQIFLQRTPSQPAFTREDIEQLNHLLPHLQRAIKLRQQFTELQRGQNFLAGGLDALAMPIFLFDEAGLVSQCNQSAETMLDSHRLIWIENGHLQTINRETNLKLNLEIYKAIEASRGSGGDLNSVVLLTRPGHLPLMLMMAPMRLATHGAALMFAFDPQASPSITTSLVRRLFGLTEAEAELSIALCCGKSLEEVAQTRGTSINTIKSQLKNVFQKTGTSRQIELVSLLLASPAYFIA